MLRYKHNCSNCKLYSFEDHKSKKMPVCNWKDAPTTWIHDIMKALEAPDTEDNCCIGWQKH